VIADADPKILEHAKAAVVDGTQAFVGTANPNRSGFEEPGAIVVEDDEPSDVAAIASSIDGIPAQTARVVSGPARTARGRIAGLLVERHDEHIAIEDLSDPAIVEALISRSRDGFHDEVLVKSEPGMTLSASRQLVEAGIAVRALPGAYLHDKYIDAGDRIYIGSANLTRNGLDEAREIGIIATPDDFDDSASSLRREFDQMWSGAASLNQSRLPG
jgi:phosphatidylserine/phosphatidylglycerophosphate/cardiolipin synthase-like enzyme